MTTLREELDWIARPFSLAPPIPEEVFTECVDSLSAIIREEDLGSGDEPNFEQGVGSEEGGEPERMAYGDRYQNREPKAKTALKQFVKWLSAMREQFPNAGKKLRALQDQVASEMDKRPDKMLRAIANWGKNKMLPQFAQRIERTGSDYKAMKSYYDELEDIIGAAA